MKYLFLLIKGKTLVLQPGRYFLQSLVMLGCVRTINDDVILNVCCSTAILQYLLNDSLTFLWCRRDAKHLPPVSKHAVVCYKGCNAT